MWGFSRKRRENDLSSAQRRQILCKNAESRIILAQLQYEMEELKKQAVKGQDRDIWKKKYLDLKDEYSTLYTEYDKLHGKLGTAIKLLEECYSTSKDQRQTTEIIQGLEEMGYEIRRK